MGFCCPHVASYIFNQCFPHYILLFQQHNVMFYYHFLFTCVSMTNSDTQHHVWSTPTIICCIFLWVRRHASHSERKILGVQKKKMLLWLIYYLKTGFVLATWYQNQHEMSAGLTSVNNEWIDYNVPSSLVCKIWGTKQLEDSMTT